MNIQLKVSNPLETMRQLNSSNVNNTNKGNYKMSKNEESKKIAVTVKKSRFNKVFMRLNKY